MPSPAPETRPHNDSSPNPDTTASSDPHPGHAPHESGACIRAATDRLQAAASIGEFTEILEQTIGDDRGALARLHQFLESAASWCHDRGAHHSAAELDALAVRLADLGDDLQLLPDALATEAARRAARTATAEAALRPSPAVGALPAANATTASPSGGSPQAGIRPVSRRR